MVRLRPLLPMTVLSLALAGCGSGTPTATATPTVGQRAAANGAGSSAPAGTEATTVTTPPAGATPGGPTPSDPTASGPTASGPAPGGVRPGPYSYTFPVRASNVDFHPTHAKYPATDIFANCGEPVVAVLDGTILEVSRSDHYVKGRPDGPLNGGLSVSLLGDDGVRYYGSHLSAIQPGITAGVRVTAGHQLGVVGHTGNANGVCHLHFGISPPCARTGDWKVRRGVVWPATYLTSWRHRGTASPVAKVAAWQRAHDCRA